MITSTLKTCQTEALYRNLEFHKVSTKSSWKLKLLTWNIWLLVYFSEINLKLKYIFGIMAKTLNSLFLTTHINNICIIRRTSPLWTNITQMINYVIRFRCNQRPDVPYATNLVKSNNRASDWFQFVINNIKIAYYPAFYQASNFLWRISHQATCMKFFVHNNELYHKLARVFATYNLYLNNK